MALQSIYPFHYRAFTAELNDSASVIINLFENREPDFWRNTLRRYSFRGSDFQQGEKVRLEFNERLSTCSDSELFDVANEILDLVSKMVLWQPEEKKEGSRLGETRETEGDLAI